MNCIGKISSSILCIFILTNTIFSNEISAGLKFQQSVGMYNENGITLEFSSHDFLDNALTFGASYITSRIGTALQSKAIPQDNFLFHTSYYFLHNKPFRPLVKLNAGYCFADYESSLFDEIDASMPLLSLETGARYAFDVPLIVQAGIGYNLITSDGSSGIGTVYPLFVQCSLMWSFSL